MYLQEVEKIDAIMHHYDAVICDIWGVLHNGVTLHQDAIAALRRIRAKGKKVILLTNAPKCSDIIQKRFATMGATDIFWDDTVTSGDTINAYLHHFSDNQKIFHWGEDADKGLYHDHNVDFAQNIEYAGVIVCTGLLYGTDEISVQEIALLQQAADKKLPFLCANPDKSVKIGDGYEFCAGSLADIYLQMGGAVEFFGKPYPAVYERCFDLLQNIDNTITNDKILAIGDGLYTDIRGAHTIGLDVVFIKQGLHQALFPKDSDFTNLREICEAHDVMPDYVMEFLK